ncbi:MAG: SAM-dependent methyltransferase [Desulfuromonadaceae bacterium]|nr:SAM-dependent methyltransferase [Desulfuromonadaceae bacterium]
MKQQQPTDKLHAFILEQIRQQGETGLSFADFMQHCLYHPRYGYYMQQRERIGKKGDFYTSTSVHHLFGVLLARQLAQMFEILNMPLFTIVEQGAGEGHLALDVLDELKRREPELYAVLDYCIIEISPDNRKRQKRILAEHACVRWTTLEQLESVRGCFISNELIDAFPVYVVEKHASKLYEVRVIEDDGAFAEKLFPAPDELKQHFSALGVEPVEGNRAELCPAAARWMTQVAGILERGFVITVDYGYPATELYAPFRRNGTLMCYAQHTTNENPYQNVGQQDITAHVDFTLLEQAGARAGLVPLYFAEQYRFLMGLGFVEELVRLQALASTPEAAMALRMTLKNLIVPDSGMGDTFKVLIQGRGVGKPDLLCSRSVADIAALFTPDAPKLRHSNERLI